MRKEREKRKKKRSRKERVKKQERRENYKLIHTDKQTDRRTDRHKSFIDMTYNTEQYSKSNSIEENQTKSNQIDLK